MRQRGEKGKGRINRVEVTRTCKYRRERLFGTSAMFTSIKFLRLAGKSTAQTHAKKKTITKIRNILVLFLFKLLS
jgi:hypothetical protein